MERSPMDSTISTSPTQSFSPLVYFWYSPPSYSVHRNVGSDNLC
jgi:hypothetical protein